MISLLLYTPISLLVFPFLISIYGRIANKCSCKMSRKSNSNLIPSLTFGIDGVYNPPSMPKVSELNSINDGTGTGSGSGTGTGSRPHTSSTLNNHIQN